MLLPSNIIVIILFFLDLLLFKIEKAFQYRPKPELKRNRKTVPSKSRVSDGLFLQIRQFLPTEKQAKRVYALRGFLEFLWETCSCSFRFSPHAGL